MTPATFATVCVTNPLRGSLIRLQDHPTTMGSMR